MAIDKKLIDQLLTDYKKPEESSEVLSGRRADLEEVAQSTNAGTA